MYVSVCMCVCECCMSLRPEKATFWAMVVAKQSPSGRGGWMEGGGMGGGGKQGS